MGGARGRLVAASEREEAIALVKEACASGAHKSQACELLGFCTQTLARWESEAGKADRRKGVSRRVGNQLSEEEKNTLLKIANSVEYRNLPPCKIVPLLADRGIYIASESSFYRVLKAHKQLTHRNMSRPRQHKKPTPCRARKRNQV